MKKACRVIIPQIVLIALLSVILAFALPSSIVIAKFDVLLGALVTCAATFSGFTLTIISILLTYSNSPFVSHLVKKGGIVELRARYIVSLAWGFLLITVCILMGCFISQDNTLAKWVAIICSDTIVLYFYNLVSSSVYLLLTVTKATEKPVQMTNEVQKPNGPLRT